MSRGVKVAVGDVFAIPLRGCGYGFGRIIHVDGKWRLAEFFAWFSEEAQYGENVVAAGRVMPVYNIVPMAIEKGDWPVVMRDADFVPSDLARLVFYKGMPGSRVYVDVGGQVVDAEDRRRTDDSTSSMPQFSEFISDRLWNALNERSLVT